MTNRSLPRYFLLYLGALVALGPVAMDAYLPALPTMADKLGVSIATLSASVSTFLVGFAFGQLLGGPISDQIGRKPVCLFGTGLFIVTSAAIAASESASVINSLRLLQAFGGGFASITAMAQVRDVYPAEEIGSRFATVMMVMMTAPVIAPIVGTGLLHWGWQAIFIFQVIYALLLLIIMWRVSPETLQHKKTALSLGRIVQQYAAIILHRHQGRFLAAVFALSIGCAAGVLLIFVTHASFTYMTYFGVSEGVFSLLFGLNAIGLIAANWLSARLLKFIDPLQIFRVVVMAQAAAVLILALLVYIDALSLVLAVPLIVFIVSCVGISNPAGAARFMAMFTPQQGGSAAAIQLVAMFVLGSAMGALASHWHDGSLKPMIHTMLLSVALSSVLLIPLRRLQVPKARR
ncbi:multidrug effflux MFS transporter [Gilvimarinus agarilyticus]|uniref:multidrug effflux MFS transporter n=1 Tax=unclassified Gilvimarinus TaxID=2642066 RepID=UPI001C083C21|nr:MULTISPECIES: multidrug effflux MFS transporter [unclassified Gilvimarinus]MBU2884649.1 multidrug effflux MFS transporter [Gilvimarinus agarilyticus]MDO6569756.1 multidrug effflux MFS transporter [Gilvimarinus sp. 2_MG-2023]MDO6747430.1 multidrug effflux MFS transporter [Gilvimarinus sp. 1_MG-2023]